MKIITISTIEPDTAMGVCLIQIVLEELHGNKVLFNGVDKENAMRLMEQIGVIGISLKAPN